MSRPRLISGRCRSVTPTVRLTSTSGSATGSSRSRTVRADASTITCRSSSLPVNIRGPRIVRNTGAIAPASTRRRLGLNSTRELRSASSAVSSTSRVTLPSLRISSRKRAERRLRAVRGCGVTTSPGRARTSRSTSRNCGGWAAACETTSTVSGCRPAGCHVGTARATRSCPDASGNSGSRSGAVVTYWSGRPITRALTPSMTDWVLTTSTTTSGVSPGSTSSSRVSDATRIRGRSRTPCPWRFDGGVAERAFAHSTPAQSARHSRGGITASAVAPTIGPTSPPPPKQFVELVLEWS